MDHSFGFVTLDGLLALNIEEVQAHLNSVHWPNTSDLESYNVFYSETKAIFLITVFINAFLEQPLLIPSIEAQAHLLTLRSLLLDEHQTRLVYLSTQHGPAQQ